MRVHFRFSVDFRFDDVTRHDQRRRVEQRGRGGGGQWSERQIQYH